MSQKMKTFDSTFWSIFVPFLIGIGILLFLPYSLTQFKVLSWGFSEKPGEIGDAIGGTLGPFIAIAAAILTFFAFWVQLKENRKKKNVLQIERLKANFMNCCGFIVRT